MRFARADTGDSGGVKASTFEFFDFLLLEEGFAMRFRSVVLIGLVVSGCGSGGSEVLFQENGGAGTDGAGGDSGAGGDAGTGGSDPGPLPPPRQLASGAAALVGMTADSLALYRTASGELQAIALTPDASPLAITDTPGTIVIKGNVVFSWADVDWTTNLGTLRFWTANAGTIEVGTALFAEDMVAATPDGRNVVYNVNVTETTTDLVIASTDSFVPFTLIPGLGRGSQETCRAHLDFVGARLFLGSCPVGSQVAKIERFEHTDAGWVSTPIATNTLSGWSADQSGERLFYQSSDYRGQFAEGDQSRTVDSSVSGGVMVPDGSSILYNVSDQLRRTDVPQINPIPIVTRGFAQRADFSPNYEHVLYSRTVTYEGGTKRDLLLTDTRAFNPTPTELVAEPVASLSRSTFTSDSKYVLFLTDVTANGSTLNIVSVETGNVRTFPNVDTVLAAKGSKLVFSDNRSDPEKYPIVADLKVVDAANDSAPTLLEAKIMDGRSFYVSADQNSVVYVRSGMERDPADPASQGVFVQSVP